MCVIINDIRKYLYCDQTFYPRLNSWRDEREGTVRVVTAMKNKQQMIILHSTIIINNYYYT